jgi:molybdate transport system substrate-binding protein
LAHSERMKRVFLSVAVALGTVTGVTASYADPARVYAAGSLIAPLTQAIEAAGLDSSQVADPVFGPSGGLRERIEKGEAADLFLSADMGHPQMLARSRPQALVIPFARNTLCLLSHQSLGLTQANALEKMLDPKVRLATSTPISDPGGDYTFAVFKRAEELRPGAEAALSQKALKLMGGPAAMAPLAGHSVAASIFLADKADILVNYCSGQAEVKRDIADLVSIRLPANIDGVATYGLAVLTDNPAAARLALFLLSEKGQAIIAENGLLPVFSEPK